MIPPFDILRIARNHEPPIQIEGAQTLDAAIARVGVLRAMFNFLVSRGSIQKTDVPAFPIANNVDNKRRGYLDKEDMDKLLKIIPGHLHPFLRFLYATGMRSGQASQLTWDMVDARVTELTFREN